VIDDYRCTTIDEDRIYAEVQAAGEAIVARSGLPIKSRWPVV
jgi:5-methylthioadenosine/S-adenosylhomocysteine deaminase